MKHQNFCGFQAALQRLPAMGLIACVCAPAWAQSKLPADLTEATLEQLANIQVTSVSKKEQSLSKAGAAVFVITQEDIRKSGIMNIPDLLRMAPGVDVARLDANAWAISIRGFNNRYSNKVLVLIDGRSVYSGLFSGVFWDQLNVPLEDIERIEVIRGPGGTVWGANAVNGVINIITKSSKDTKGGLVTAQTGSTENLGTLLQYGGKIGAKGAFRAFGNGFNVEPGSLGPGVSGADGWHGSSGGFRSDWDLSARDTLTVQGALSQTGEGQTLTEVLARQLPSVATFNDQLTVGAGNLQAQYEHTFADGSELTWRTYFQRFHRFDQAEINEADVDTGLQYNFQLGSRNSFVAGAGYRLTDSSYLGAYSSYLVPDHSEVSLFSVFLQDELTLTDHLSLTMGSKLEHNAFTGFEYEPSAQLVWTPKQRQSVWVSVARAIRQPSLLEENVSDYASIVPLQGGAFGAVIALGNHDENAETMLDYELGYRNQVSRRLSFDISTFWSNYTDLRTVELGGAPFFALTPAPPHLVIPEAFGNLAQAQNFGGELAASWDVTKWWRLSPSVSLLHMGTSLKQSSQDNSTVFAVNGESPRHMAQLRSSVKLSHRLEWDTSAYFTGVLPNGAVFAGVAPSGPAPAYTRLDTHLGWTAGESVYLSVSGQNLLAPRHFEFLDGEGIITPTQVERSIVAKITWHF